MSNKEKPRFNFQIVEGKMVMPSEEKTNLNVWIESQFPGDFYLEVGKVVNRRTDSQNRALHTYFTLVAEALNDGGFTLDQVVKLDVPFTPALVKELIWRKVQKQVLSKSSTTELDKQSDITEIYDIVNRSLSEKLKISVAFPSIENQNYELK